MKPLRYLLFATCWLAASGILAAQDTPPITLGDFDTQGSVTAGFRATSVTGRQQKYLELFNLKQGLRLFDFSLDGKAKPGTSTFADTFSINASGLGGDPFPSAQLTVKKNNLYDLRVNYRQSYFYWDRDDSVLSPLPQPVPSPPIQRGLTTNQDWFTVRKFGSADFQLHATNNLRFSFEYGRNSREGPTDTTRVMEYFNAPSLWETFVRGNPYVVVAPVNEVADRIAGGIDYSKRGWNFHYRLGYQTFEQNMQWNNITSPEESINVDTPSSARQLLTNASWSEFRNLKTPSSEFSYNGRVNSRLTIRGGYIYFRYRGPDTVDASYQGITQSNTAATTFAPYSVSLSTRSQASEPDHVVDQGFSLKLTEMLNLNADYRYSQLNENGHLLFHSLRDSTTPSDGTVDSTWREVMHQADVNLEYTPLRGLLVRGGLRYLKNDIDVTQNGIPDAGRSANLNTVWPVGSVFYRPSKMFSIRADIDSITSGTSYTRISPHTDIGTRIVARFQPTDNLTLEENLVVRNRQLLDTGFRNTIRTNGFNASYALDRRLSVYGGFSYDSYSATAGVSFLRGTAPLNVVWFDQTVNRIWQGGITTEPIRRLGFTVSGNYVRTTGAGVISGEPPTFGPLRWPMITFATYYNFPKAGRLSLDLQRTYYIEELLTNNNFEANLMTLKWTKDF